MKVEEAIKEVQERIAIAKKHYPEEVPEYIEALEMCVRSLEKQIPTKPIVKIYSPALCPCCKKYLSESIGDGYYKHWVSQKICDCGQKLDWSGIYGD